MMHHPIDIQDPRQHAALVRIAAQCAIPWTVAVTHAWVSADGDTVGVTLRSVDYAEPVRYHHPVAPDPSHWEHGEPRTKPVYPLGYLDGP